VSGSERQRNRIATLQTAKPVNEEWDAFGVERKRNKKKRWNKTA